MPFFQKKPVVIEARQLTKDSFDEIFTWINSNGKDGHCYLSRSMSRPLVIRTLEGDHEAAIGDWIIKGVKGEFYPYKPDIFEMTYEPHHHTGGIVTHPLTDEIIDKFAFPQYDDFGGDIGEVNTGFGYDDLRAAADWQLKRCAAYTGKQMMSKAKLLVVNLQDPTKTKYMSPKQIATFLWGRRISNYPILKVQDGSTNQIVITDGNIFLIEKQLTEALHHTTTREES